MQSMSLVPSFIVIAMIAAIAAPAQTVIYVDASAEAGANNGSNWCNAYLELQEALAFAQSHPSVDTIRVADGTYLPDPTGLGDREATFQLINGVTLEGGYAGCADGGDLRDIELYETILSGDLNGDDLPDWVNRSDNSYHVFLHPYGTNLDATAVLDGVTVSGGTADLGTYPHDRGGGMWNVASSPTLINCAFSGNSAAIETAYGYGEGFGGGMANYFNSNATLTNCTFSGNVAGAGGGVYSEFSNPRLVTCTFSGNVGAGMFNDYYGSPTLANCTFTENLNGGMYNDYYSSPMLTSCTFSENLGPGMSNGYNCSPTLDHCTFNGNQTDGRGGGMDNYFASPTLNNCTFSGNSVTGGYTYSGGGGMYNWQGNPALNNCTFSGNSAYDNCGGGMYNVGGTPTLINCTFSGNSGHIYGGGMYNDGGSPTVTGCTFSGNSVTCSIYSGAHGGGIYNRGSSPTLVNCTFSGNSVANECGDANGDGMYNRESSPALINCIIWGNTAPQGPELFNDGSSTADVTYGNIQGDDVWPGEGNINDDPDFSRNPDPGPDGNWDGTDDDYGDLRLLTDSPCIDAGDNDAVTVPTDLDGHIRIWDGDDNGEAIVDMGAYEFGSYAYGDLDCDGEVNLFDIDPFVLVVAGTAPTYPEYYAVYPDCDHVLADIDADGAVSLFDIDAFVALLTGR